MRNYKKIAVIVALFLLVPTSFFLGYSVREIRTIRTLFIGPTETDFSLIMEAYRALQNNFVEPKRIEYQRIIHGAIEGMVESLDDPQTVFFNPEETKRFLEDIEGRFEGVGMEIDIRNNQLQVISPMKGMPADRAGLLPGDLILKIDERETKNLSREEAVNLIRGPKGTKVILSILRVDWEEPKNFSIIRDLIVLPSIEWQIVNGNIAHLKLHHFYRGAYNDFQKIAREIIESPSQGIILDLRNNAGGYLNVSQDIGGWFLEKGKTFVIEKYPHRENKMKTEGTGRLSHYPLVVLINKGSASASEILAGALRDNRGIQLVGETSFGKGSIQSIEYLSDGSAIKITVAHWLTPSRKTISDKGLTPDVKIEMTVEGYENKKDPQLDEAVEIIKKML